jgi:iron complex transport system substrate-binding protein
MKRSSLSQTFLLVLLASLLLTACSSPTVPAPAEQIVPETAPTNTSAPTGLPEPAATAEPSPTEMPLPAPISLTDGLDRSVTLKEPAQRIVSLAPSNIEILYAIGAGDQVVARDDFANYPEEAASLPTIGGSFSGFNNEAIVNLKPDLVLAAEINTPEQVKALEDLGITVYYLLNPTDIEGMYENLMIVATLTGREEQAEELTESLKQRVAVVVEKVADAPEQPKVFYELDSTDPNAPYTAGSGTFIDTLITMAGGQNIGKALKDPYGQLSVEELLVQNPEIILLGDAAYGATVESVTQRTGWEKIDAVQNGKVYPFNDDLASRPGPRLVDALEELARLFHPELFQ